MSEKTERMPPDPEIIKRLQAAFPSTLVDGVDRVLERLPVGEFKIIGAHDIGPIAISGEIVHIPWRFYTRAFYPFEPAESSLAGLSDRHLAILACIYTRHHDGYVRQKYAERLFSFDAIWVAPFVLQLLGEYVIEIVEAIAQNTRRLPRETYDRFIQENPAFTRLLTQRIVSYWNCYQRVRVLAFKEYAGFQAADALGLWNKKDIRHLMAR